MVAFGDVQATELRQISTGKTILTFILVIPVIYLGGAMLSCGNYACG